MSSSLTPSFLFVETWPNGYGSGVLSRRALVPCEFESHRLRFKTGMKDEVDCIIDSLNKFLFIPHPSALILTLDP